AAGGHARGSVSSQDEAHADLVLEPADEARGHFRLVARGGEGVVPLARGEAAEPLARPAHVGGRDAAVELLVLPARVVEPDETVAVHALDEALPLEILHVVARPGAQGGPRAAEGGPEVLHDEEGARPRRR